MKEKIFSLFRKWPFWIGLQASLIFLLNIVGNVRAENTLHALSRNLGAMFGNFLFTFLGFPSGIYFLFHDSRVPGILQVFFAYLLPLFYYSVFLFLVSYITKEKKHWKWMAIGLLVFMLLSFGGCARVIDLQLVIT